MKNKILITVITALFTILQVSAQAHDNSKGACRLVKSRYSVVEPGATCPACVAKDKKEQVARDAENKRRNDAVIAAAKAKQKARELEIIKEKELAEKNKPKEVFVTMPKNTTVKNTIPDKKTESKGVVKNYFYTENNDINNQSISDMIIRYQKISNYFLINNEKKFTNNEFKACIGGLWKHRDKNDFNFPPNVGIVVLNESFKDKNGKSIQISDLIDLKGNRILNDNSISTIIHFSDEYFIIFRGLPVFFSGNIVSFSRGGGDAFIYNLKTQQKHTLQRYTNDEGMDGGYEVDFVVNLTGNPAEIDKSKYKARFKSKTGFKKSTYYYITIDNKIEQQIIKY
jgi:hypothetical protein